METVEAQNHEIFSKSLSRIETPLKVVHYFQSLCGVHPFQSLIGDVTEWVYSSTIFTFFLDRDLPSLFILTHSTYESYDSFHFTSHTTLFILHSRLTH